MGTTGSLLSKKERWAQERHGVGVWIAAREEASECGMGLLLRIE